MNSRLMVHNFGKTPAREVKGGAAAHIGYHPLTDSDATRDFAEALYCPVINPGDSVPIYVETKQRTIEHLRENLGSAFHAYGIITYVDVFGESHQTDFSWQATERMIRKCQMERSIMGNDAT